MVMGSKQHSRAFARSLRKERERRGLTRRELALSSGVSERSLANYENAINEPPLGQAAKLADALGLTINDMLAEREPTASTPALDAREMLTESIRLQQTALNQLADQREDT